MAQLHTKVKLYLEANSKTEEELLNDNILLQNVGSGDYIHTWNVDGVSKPTDEQLNALESQADAVETLNQVYAKRKMAYPDIYDYMDGIVKDDQTQINKYIADCQAVKVRYKKG